MNVHNRLYFIYAYNKCTTANLLEKLQDGRNHLCYGLHGEVLVTAADNTSNHR